MKTNQIIALLNLFAQSLDLTGGRHRSRAITLLAQSFEPLSEFTSAQLIKRIGKALDTPRDGMREFSDATLAEALPLLSALQSLLIAAGAKPAAKDIGAIYSAIKASPITPIEALASALRTPLLPRRQPRAAQSPPIDHALARELADRLTSASSDDHAFKALVKDIKARKLNKQTVNAIANAFLGRDRQSPDKSVQQAFKSIEDRHQINALSESRARKIDSINL